MGATQRIRTFSSGPMSAGGFRKAGKLIPSSALAPTESSKGKVADTIAIAPTFSERGARISDADQQRMLNSRSPPAVMEMAIA